jgi:exosortase/archaeosortase family protein
VRSCSLFFATIGLFIFLYSRLIESRFFGSFLAFNARITAALLDFTGRDVTVKDNVVSSPRFAFQIVDLCTAIMPMMILTAAVLAFPSRVKEKGVGLLLGLLGLFVVNQIRLVSLFYVGIYVPSIFGATHLLIWQALMIVLAIGLWLVWAYRYVRTASS